MRTSNATWMEIAQKMTAAQLAEHYGISVRAVWKRNDRLKVRCLDGTFKVQRAPMPEGFADMELGVTQNKLAQRLGVSIRDIRRWSAEVELQLGAPAKVRWLARTKAEYLANWTTRKISDTCKALKVGRVQVVAWAVECGATDPDAHAKRSKSAKQRWGKREPAITSPDSRHTWFGSVDCRMTRDQYVQVIRPWCPAWEMEESDA